jgi:predicted acyltransferase
MDQFRGYAILGMLMVDYFECFHSATYQLHHHRDFMTYADTIAPAFMFVVGMGMRLSFKRRIQKVGVKQARADLMKRYAMLVLIAFTMYTGYLWDALMNIGLAGLLGVWVADRRPSLRIAAGLVLLALYQALFSFTSYGGWLLGTVEYTSNSLPTVWKLIPFGPELMDCNINGGPIGHWSWLLMLLCGTVGYDILATASPRKVLMGLLACGLAFAAAGWALHLPWPDVKAEWVFSKYYMTAPYALWGSAICFFTLAAFYVLCDMWRVEIPTLTVLGMNPLFIYILQWCIMESAGRFIPRSTQNWPAILAGFAVFYGGLYAIAYYMYRKNIFVKL